MFEREDTKAQKNHISIDSEQIKSLFDVQYGEDPQNNIFDFYYPADCDEKLPTILYVHGGGYVAGNKIDINRFVKILTENGYCVVNMEYTKVDGKEHKYLPTPIFEVFELFKFLKNNEQFSKHIDYNNIFLAGDSAGAHIVSLVANIQTNPSLKYDFNLTGGPQVKGLILTCPVLGEFNFGVLPIKNAYFKVLYGEDNPYAPICNNFNVLTDKFPPSILISTQNDFVSIPHANAFSKKAKELGLSLRYCLVQSGYKLFHNSMLKYVEKYPQFVGEICSFVDDAVNGQFAEGVQKKIIKEKQIDNKKVDNQKTDGLSFE